jgi:hypothetical protein
VIGGASGLRPKVAWMLSLTRHLPTRGASAAWPAAGKPRRIQGGMSAGASVVAGAGICAAAGGATAASQRLAIKTGPTDLIIRATLSLSSMVRSVGYSDDCNGNE